MIPESYGILMIMILYKTFGILMIFYKSKVDQKVCKVQTVC